MLDPINQHSRVGAKAAISGCPSGFASCATIKITGPIRKPAIPAT